MIVNSDYAVTEEQQAIHDYRPLGLIITAPAGCGKTEALAYRVKGLLDRWDFSGNGRRLLVLSFTNQAKDNISERIRKFNGVRSLRQKVTVCNFHGLASRIIKAHGNVVGIGEEWTVVNYDWNAQAIRKLGVQGKTASDVKNALRRIKQQGISDQQTRMLVSSLDGEVRRITSQIEEERFKKKILTYDDQIRVALWILQDERVARLYRNHFFAAIVDEFQDMTLQQLSLVEILCGENVTYAGDLAQGIFSFAGACPNFTYEKIKSNGAKQIKLQKSFRSSPAVLHTVNSLSSRTSSEKLVAAFPSRWGSGGLTAYVPFHHLKEEAEWVIRVSQAILKHCPKQRVGIVARTNSRIGPVKETLRSWGVDYTDWSGGSFSPKVAHTLRIVCDSLADEGNCEVDAADIYSLVLEKGRELDEIDRDELESAGAWLVELLFQLRVGVREIRSRIRKIEGGKTIASRSGIHCLTGHSGKGQQFDWVFILGLEKGSIPSYWAMNGEQIVEEARVLLVMISRARIGVISTRTAYNARGYFNDESEFLESIKQVPNLLVGENQVIAWFRQIDWSEIQQM